MSQSLKQPKVLLWSLGLILLILLGLWWSRQDGDLSDTSQGPYQALFTSPQQSLEQPVCDWLAAAQRSLDLAAFDIELPCIEQTLLARQAAGVRVRVVTDSDHLTPQVKALQKAGIPVVDDQRSAFMHNKFLIRDQESVWTGSMNLTPSGVASNNNNVLMINDSGVAQLYQAEFEEMLGKEFGPRSPRQNLPAIFSLQGHTLEVLFSPEDPVQERVLDLLQAAKKEVLFLAFSFTDDKMGAVLQAQGKAGLTIRGVFENMGATSKYSEYGRLKRAGLDVRRDGNPAIMHHKVFIIDSETVVTGSYNFSKNADRSNDENLVVVHDPELAKQYQAEFERVYAAGK